MRNKPGVIRDAIVGDLSRRRTDASVEEIHKAVRAVVGESIPPSSGRSYLRLNVGRAFERTGRGRYRLIER